MHRPRGAAEGSDHGHAKQGPHIPACYLCRAAHTACGPERPCQQCVRKGRPDHCCDPPPRKKGRPARNDPRYRSKHALPPPPEPQPQPPTGIGRADDEVVLLLIEEVVRLRRELEAAQLELAQVGGSTSPEVAEGGVGWRKRPRSDGPVVERRSSSSSTVPVVPAEDAEGIDDGETDSALREARARMPFLWQYRLGPDRPFVVRDLFEKPILVSEKHSNGQLVFSYANEAFANLFKFTSRDVGRSIGSFSACHPNQRAISFYRIRQEPWSVSDILAVSRLMRGMDGQLWRVAANLQFFYDESGRRKYSIGVLQHWEAGQLQPGEVFDAAPLGGDPVPPSPPEVSAPAIPSSQPRPRPPGEDDGFWWPLDSALSDEDIYNWVPQRAQRRGACGYCQTARIRCDQARPCQQCVKKGRAAQCGNPPKASAKGGAAPSSKEKDSGVNQATACPDYNILWE